MFPSSTVAKRARRFIEPGFGHINLTSAGEGLAILGPTDLKGFKPISPAGEMLPKIVLLGKLAFNISPTPWGEEYLGCTLNDFIASKFRFKDSPARETLILSVMPLSAIKFLSTYKLRKKPLIKENHGLPQKS